MRYVDIHNINDIELQNLEGTPAKRLHVRSLDDPNSIGLLLYDSSPPRWTIACYNGNEFTSMSLLILSQLVYNMNQQLGDSNGN